MTRKANIDSIDKERYSVSSINVERGRLDVADLPISRQSSEIPRYASLFLHFRQCLHWWTHEVPRNEREKWIMCFDQIRGSVSV